MHEGGDDATVSSDPSVPEALRDRLAERVDVDDVELAAQFARAMLRRAPDVQLDTADPDALADEVAVAFRFFRERRPGELAIRATDPDVSIDGWSGPGTVIEVCTEDRPFLLATITEEIRAGGHEVVRVFHPILGVERDGDELIRIGPARGAAVRESFVHVELDTKLDPSERDALVGSLRSVLEDVLAATGDWPRMQVELEALSRELRDLADDDVGEGADEVADLVDWLLADNFIVLGCRNYQVIDVDGTPAVRVEPGSGLGILADRSSQYDEPVQIDESDPHMRERHGADRLLTVARSHRYSTVVKRVRMLNVWIKRHSDAGAVTGQFRILGLFARRAYSERSSTIPVLRDKLRWVLEQEDLVEDSHDERAFVSLFEAVPKEELFELDADMLRRTLLELHAAEAQRDVGLFVRADPGTRNVSVIASIPRDRYDATLRKNIQRVLLERFRGTGVDVDLSLGARPDAIVRFAVHVPEGDIPEVPAEELEAAVRALARTWQDDLLAELIDRHGEAEGHRLAREVGGRMPATYREHTPVEFGAADDIEALDRLRRSGGELDIRLHADPRPDRTLSRLKISKSGPGIELSRILPILESIGLTVSEELPFKLEGSGDELHVHDYGVHVAGRVVDEADGPRIADAVLAAWDGQLDVDSLNRLVLEAGLDWDAVAVLRAYRRYRRQVGTAYTADYQNDALVEHPAVARALMAYFEARFDPSRFDVRDGGAATEVGIAAARQEVLDSCEVVERLDHDRILRGFLALIDATLRTNRYHGAGRHLALKFDSSAVPQMPKPVPHREIFVHSTDVEGIHLRGGPVARGGIRWSDRRDDFRTEVLGLMQAQMLKNAVIVPTGAKGGFVLKRDRSAGPPEVERHYRTFIHALLEVTDNVEAGEIVPPPDVRRVDGDDPYLVVAADRGTATFSDTANQLAKEHGFWLGDAFASGGSRGYDHKALGITARGAWVAVTRHFRELGIDIQEDPVSVVGIGDMSGDVFGNAMLQSSSLRLVAAFDHRDIFLDPDPDPAGTFEARRRLFADPGLTWQDFDRGAISAGGGVWSRSEKSIPLSPQVRELLRTDAERLSPPELLQAVLRAPVDLLFAGGIGTFVRAAHETDDEIGDRANDEGRIAADELRARVVGEGANLALTQAARIQYARRGGRVNTDFIDNSAGVDISDHEVNLKILLRLAVEEDEIDGGERDALLVEVTDDVIAACLRDVDLQTWLLSREVDASAANLESYEALMVHLESAGMLDREVEGLPTSEEMDERRGAGAGLTRPELAVLVATTKRDLSSDLVASDLPEQPAVRRSLVDYFPARLAQRFDHLLDRHRLRGELIATQLANEVVNRMGITFVHRMARELGAPRPSVLAAYRVAREVADADRYWEALEDLERLADPVAARELSGEVAGLLESMTRSYLRDAELGDIAAAVRGDREAFHALESAVTAARLPSSGSRRSGRVDDLVALGLDPTLAVQLRSMSELAIAPDVASVARSTGRGSDGVAAAFLQLRDALGLERLGRLLDGTEPEGRWQRWQHRGLVDDLRALHRVAAHRALTESPDIPELEAVEAFLDARTDAIEHATRLGRQVEEEDQDTARLDAISVSMRAVRDALRSVDRRP